MIIEAARIDDHQRRTLSGHDISCPNGERQRRTAEDNERRRKIATDSERSTDARGATAKYGESISDISGESLSGHDISCPNEEIRRIRRSPTKGD
jgi:hypothetical protein